MRGELLVPLHLEAAQHFIERVAGRRSRRAEPPVTFRATKAPKTLFLNPYQPAAHMCFFRRVPMSTRFLLRNEHFRCAISPLLSQLAYGLIAEKIFGQLARGRRR